MPHGILSRAWHRTQPQLTILAYFAAFVKRQKVWVVSYFERGADLSVDMCRPKGQSFDKAPAEPITPKKFGAAIGAAGEQLQLSGGKMAFGGRRGLR